MARRRMWWGVAFIWLAVVLSLTLQSAPDQAARVAELRWYCVLCGEAGVADFILNLIFFVPFGIAAHALQLQRGRTFAGIVALTVAIELTQGLLLVGRDGSLGDVIANAGGGALGWMVYPVLLHLARPSRAFARHAIGVVLAVSVVVWLATGVGLQLDLGTASPWTGQLQHVWPGHDPFPGRIRSARFNGVPVPNDPFDAPVPSGDSAVLQVDLVRTTPMPARRASLVRIVDPRGATQVSLVATGTDLVAEVPVRATHWGLHTPQWGFRGAMTVAAGEPWSVTARWTRGTVSVTTADSARARATTRSQSMSIALGWAFIHPFVLVVRSDGGVWNYLWLGWWFGLIGWLGGSLGWRAAAGAIALQLSMLLGAAALTRTPWRAGELIAALVVAGSAAAAARFNCRRDDSPRGPLRSE